MYTCIHLYKVAILHHSPWVIFFASINTQSLYINNGGLYIIYIYIIYLSIHICNASFSMGDILSVNAHTVCFSTLHKSHLILGSQ